MHHRHYLIIFSLSLLSLPVLAQKKIPKPESANRVIMDKSDTLYTFYAFKILPNKKMISLDESKEYFWYQSNNIHRTIGGYDGRILHGNYKVLYPGGNLKETGTFSYGLKTGIWRSWAENGLPEDIKYWKDGKQEGSHLVYDSTGRLVKEYNYHNNMLSGVQLEVINDTLSRKTVYKKGKLVEEVSPQKITTDSTDKKDEKN